MKRSVRDSRHKLYKTSTLLKDIANKCEDVNKSTIIRSEQTKFYKKWLFYNNIIKEIEKKD